ncbi:putative 4-hydroxy-4-methyl-2-oxoglutarate aldolase [Colwellia psychrerythraea]|uniref:4-hydroxy-4-methyl-2-oxoglutarate aldolase n=1 Tax=Colwellia psychrerythraea TaxID=28229 RepID=A0A099KG13_COLPS|nr:putative 4-hydroxy-4-methyl-2-oxoglutarate aldolase [Colwellia psychrerythraea]KGJ89699.1 regulator of ribonuclease activity A [Colwellia psychrerythraea]
MLDLLPDLFDQYPEQLDLADPAFTDYGKNTIFYGEIVTVSCFEDNSKVKELLATDGTNKVLVVDGKGSMNRALLGDLIAENAVKHNWQAVVINGCIRDAGTIATLAIAVKALGCNPIKTEKLGVGDINMVVSFAGLDFIPGWTIYGDANGLAVSESKLISSDSQANYSRNMI